MKKIALVAAVLLAGSVAFAQNAASSAPVASSAPASTAAKAAPATKTAKTVKAVPAAVKTVTLEGTIVKATPAVAADSAKKVAASSASIDVAGADGKNVTIFVKSSIAITGADGKAITFDKLAKDAKVKVTYTIVKGIAHAVSVTLE